MKRLIETLKNIWSIQELRQKIVLTLGLLFIYRLGSNVVLPGIDPNSLSQLQSQTSTGVLGILNAFTGGAFANASVLALGIMPYISASIVIQLLGLAVPSLQKMQKEGESGRRKMNQITRLLTIAITAAQAPGYIANLMAQGVNINTTPGTFWYMSIVVLVAGTVFAMWLGERITDKGIGNGISLLIMVGIVASFPQAIIQEFASKNSGGGGLILFLVEIAALLIVIMLSVALVQATRKVPVQYAKRTAGGGVFSGASMARQYIPLKVNAAGVMPIIFAQAIMFIPVTVLQYAGAQGEGTTTFLTLFSNIQGFWYNLIFAVMIILFTYFYTAIQINTNQIADDLKRNGGFIPGIKPGKSTAEFLDQVLSKITFPGSIFLAFVAILPAFAMVAGVNTAFAYFYGGTSLLIMVGVTLDTLQQIESYLLNRHYDGLMKTGRISGRVAATSQTSI